MKEPYFYRWNKSKLPEKIQAAKDKRQWALVMKRRITLYFKQNPNKQILIMSDTDHTFHRKDFM